MIVSASAHIAFAPSGLNFSTSDPSTLSDQPSITGDVGSDFTSLRDRRLDRVGRGIRRAGVRPRQAKELWAEADAIAPWSGSFQIGYNADGGHQPWVDAVSNSLKNTLGIEASGAPYVDFATLRQAVNDRTITTAFRSGWQADYPSLYNFLGTAVRHRRWLERRRLLEPRVDQLSPTARRPRAPRTRSAKYQEAQEILFQDLPAIPLWYSNVAGGFAETVDNVTFGWNSVPLYDQITKD